MIVRTAADARAAEGMRDRRPGAVVVALSASPGDPPDALALPVARVRVRTADPALSARITAAIESRLRAVPPPRLRPRVRVREAPLEDVRGRIAVLRVDRRRARELPSLLAALETAGAAAIQLVCEPPLSPRIERAVFAALESRRDRGGPPVVLAPFAHRAGALDVSPV